MRRNILIALLSIFSFAAVAQDAQIEFIERTHDFGEIKEADGFAEFEFKFKNTGKVPVKLMNVKASCGCTTPAWSKDVVMPGKEGFVKAKYNPTNRPGQFNKSLTITSNASTQIIFIKGNVIPKPKTIEDTYRHKIGGIRVKYFGLNMGRVYVNQAPAVKKFEVYNDSDKAISFLDDVKVPAHIKISYEPKTIQPKGKGFIVIAYDGKIKNEYGFIDDQIKLYTDEATKAEKSFRVSASLEEKFPNMTEAQLAQAPILKFDKIVHDFGTIKQSEVAKTTFTYTNTGKSTLEVRAIKPNCTCAVATGTKTNVKPGESVTFEVTFNPAGRKGKQQKNITFYTNSPKNPIQKITVKAMIQL